MDHDAQVGAVVEAFAIVRDDVARSDHARPFDCEKPIYLAVNCILGESVDVHSRRWLQSGKVPAFADDSLDALVITVHEFKRCRLNNNFVGHQARIGGVRNKRPELLSHQGARIAGHLADSDRLVQRHDQLWLRCKILESMGNDAIRPDDEGPLLRRQPPLFEQWSHDRSVEIALNLMWV